MFTSLLGSPFTALVNARRALTHVLRGTKATESYPAGDPENHLKAIDNVLSYKGPQKPAVDDVKKEKEEEIQKEIEATQKMEEERLKKEAEEAELQAKLKKEALEKEEKAKAEKEEKERMEKEKKEAEAEKIQMEKENLEKLTRRPETMEISPEEMTTLAKQRESYDSTEEVKNMEREALDLNMKI